MQGLCGLEGPPCELVIILSYSQSWFSLLQLWDLPVSRGVPGLWPPLVNVELLWL